MWRGTTIYALVFGLFLGLCIWKFGNPVILDHKIIAPKTLEEFLNAPWPLHWANWILLPLAIIGGLLIFKNRNLRQSDKSEIKNRKSEIKWLWLLPLLWLGWQFLSATQTVDATLTNATLWQFSGCVACYFLGALLLSREQLARWLLIGVLAAFAFCLVRAVNQKVFEFPAERQSLIEGEQCGWTNFPPEAIASMRLDGVIITTNGVDVANPVIMKKIEKGRVSGTLVYPNALAGIILLLWPVSLALAFGATKNMRPLVRLVAVLLTVFLGSAALFWSGSKLGWLVAIGLAGLYLLRMDWPKKLKWVAVATVLVLGLGIFVIRFQHYFATGATSASARLDYWRAAVQTTVAKPVFGTGPGTFQRPYAQLKSPDSEMARLTHNDYLEQFSDSGLMGGVFYFSWIGLALVFIGRKVWVSRDSITFGIFGGLFAWFLQGFGEFSLYLPALAWTAFTLLGLLIGQKIKEFDK
jgi:O-antigen ligase